MTRFRARICVVVLWGVVVAHVFGQERFTHGQTVTPAFEGWEMNPDGTFNMVFGYLNRNWEETFDLPIGPHNNVEPGGPDQGQPTHLLPRRNQFVFRAKVPKDFGNKELVWTLVSHGKTERAYATLKPAYMIDDRIIMMNNAGNPARGQGGLERVGEQRNRRPSLRLLEDRIRSGKVGTAITLTALVSDDGIPPPSPAPRLDPRSMSATIPGRFAAVGLRVAWFVYRGTGSFVLFSPTQFKVYKDIRDGSPWAPGWAPPPIPPDGRYVTA